MEHENVEQVIDENCRRGRPRNRRTSVEEWEFRERLRVLRNERVRRHSAQRNNNRLHINIHGRVRVTPKIGVTPKVGIDI